MKRFPKNAKVCFIGDSITCNGGFISRIVDFYHTSFPEDNINFYNCGASGAGSRSILELLDVDTLGYAPTHAVIMHGVNDSGRSELANGRSVSLYEQLSSRFECFKQNYAAICDKLEERGVEITLMTPVPLDEYSSSPTPAFPGSFALMSAYAEFIRNFARDRGYPLVDQFREFARLLACGEEVYNDDRVHPNDYGQYCIAKSILAAQGFEIGEYGDIPSYLDVWREKTRQFRYDIITVECLLLGRYDLTEEESFPIIKKKLETEENPFVISIAGKYFEAKPMASKIKSDMLREMEIELKK